MPATEASVDTSHRFVEKWDDRKKRREKERRDRVRAQRAAGEPNKAGPLRGIDGPVLTKEKRKLFREMWAEGSGYKAISAALGGIKINTLKSARSQMRLPARHTNTHSVEKGAIRVLVFLNEDDARKLSIASTRKGMMKPDYIRWLIRKENP